mmetsp:Transcript_61691/g.98308  ORF Transcript_61691/g.98308 Transcript_61691/m.98308 type:complete len:326 (+) Transcript_61691:30-1007(+)
MASGVTYWTVHDVKRWIRSWDVLYGHFVTSNTIRNLLAFADANNIDGEALIYFTKDELKTYGLDQHDISVTIKCIDELIIGSYIDYMMDNSYHFFPKSLPPKQQLLVHLPPKPTDTQQEIMAYDHQHNQLQPVAESKQAESQQADIEVEDGWEIPFTYPKPKNMPSRTQSHLDSQHTRNALQSNTTASTNPFQPGYTSSAVASRPNANPMSSGRIPQNAYIENNATNQAALASIASNQQVHHASRSAMNDKNVQSAAWNAYRGGGNDPNANRQLVGSLAKNKQVQSAAVSVAKDKKVQKAAYQGVKKNATRKNAKKAKRLLSFHM